jgi:hypothetical protein
MSNLKAPLGPIAALSDVLVDINDNDKPSSVAPSSKGPTGKIIKTSSEETTLEGVRNS